MGNDQSQGAEAESKATYQQGKGRLKTVPVILNVYEPAPDPSRPQQQMPGAVGIFHTGLQIYGVEYAYAGGEGVEGSGIQPQTPKYQPQGSPWVYKESVQIGETEWFESEIKDLVYKMGAEYPASSYDLMENNCNHFTADFSKRITRGGKSIPSYINRAATLGSMFKGFMPGPRPKPKPAAEAPPKSIFETSKGYALGGTSPPPEGGKPSSGRQSGSGSSAAAAAGGAGVITPSVVPAAYDIPDTLLKCAAQPLALEEGAPTIKLQLVLPSGAKHAISLNPTHTVLQLYQHTRHLIESEPGYKKGQKFSLKTGFPPKPLLVALQTVEEANLKGASVQTQLH